MTRWEEGYKKHPIHATYNAVVNCLKDPAFKGLVDDSRDESARLQKGLNLYEEVMSITDIELITNNQLSTLNSTMQQVNALLNNFRGNRNLSYLQQANNEFDRLLEQLAPIAALSFKNPLLQQSELRRVEKLALKTVESARAKKNEINRKFGGLKKSMDALEGRAQELDREAETRVKELTGYLEDFMKQFAESEATRTQRFAEYFSNYKTQSEDDLRKLLEQFEKHMTSQAEKNQSALDKTRKEANTRLSSIREIHGLVSDDGISGAYKKNESDEFAKARFWRGVSFGFISLAVLWSGYKLWGEGLTWALAVSSMPLTLILASAAGYAGKISAGHRRESLRVKQFALEIEALQPYLERLPNSSAQKIREDLAPEYFGKVPEVEGGQIQPENLISLEELSERLDALKRAVEKS